MLRVTIKKIVKGYYQEYIKTSYSSITENNPIKKEAQGAWRCSSLAGCLPTWACLMYEALYSIPSREQWARIGRDISPQKCIKCPVNRKIISITVMTEVQIKTM
jgi:hypothetical protein